MNTVNLNGVNYTVTCPNLKAQKHLQPAQDTLNFEMYKLRQLSVKPAEEIQKLVEEKGASIFNLSPESIQAASDYVFHSIQRNHPDFQQDILEEGIDVRGLLDIYGKIMDSLNLPNQEDTPSGEALTGTTSLPSSAPLLAGDGTPSSENSISQESSSSTTPGEDSLPSQSN
jgi:hypothetical protein